MPASLSDLASGSFGCVVLIVVEFVGSAKRGARIPSRMRCRKRLINIAALKFHVPSNGTKVVILTDRIRLDARASPDAVNTRGQTLIMFACVEEQRYSETVILMTS